MVKGIM